MKIARTAAAMALAAATLAGCSTSADIVSHNISLEADEFRVDRRIVGINLMTGAYLFEARGKCSIKADTADQQLEVTCKIGPDAYQKHYIGIAPMATYTVEQLATSDVADYSYYFKFNPLQIAPTIVG